MDLAAGIVGDSSAAVQVDTGTGGTIAMNCAVIGDRAGAVHEDAGVIPVDPARGCVADRASRRQENADVVGNAAGCRRDQAIVDNRRGFVYCENSIACAGNRGLCCIDNCPAGFEADPEPAVTADRAKIVQRARSGIDHKAELAAEDAGALIVPNGATGQQPHADAVGAGAAD